MPELPEVEALAEFLRERAAGHVVARVDVLAFSALKTHDPPVTALGGLTVTGAARHGKFLDLDVDGLHLVIHLARAGWLRWRDELPAEPVRPGGRNPLALRVHLDDGSGFDLTEAGTKKGLAVYVVHAPPDVPGVASLGPDPLDDALHDLEPAGAARGARPGRGRERREEGAAGHQPGEPGQGRAQAVDLPSRRHAVLPLLQAVRVHGHAPDAGAHPAGRPHRAPAQAGDARLGDPHRAGAADRLLRAAERQGHDWRQQEIARIQRGFDGVGELLSQVFTGADRYVLQMHVQPPEPMRTLLLACPLAFDTAVSQNRSIGGWI